MITISGGRGWGGTASDFAGEDLLEFWAATMGELLEEIGETGVLDGWHGELGELSAEIADGLVGLLYDAPDDARLDVDDLRAQAREVGENGPEFDLFQALFAASFRELGERLALLGAVEYEPGDGDDSAEETLRTLPVAEVPPPGLLDQDPAKSVPWHGLPALLPSRSAPRQ